MKLLFAPIERGPLRVFARAGSHNVVAFEGVLREQDPAAWLCPLIDTIHARATDEHFKEVVLDLRRLEYANAAAWKCIVYWVQLLKDGGESSYHLRIYSDDKHRWQHIGMTALRVFGQSRLEITVYREGQLA
ncbi:MAG TPA: hypothetical protein VFF06_24765 [Polyangia bacterium]|nr:hypothetical protein [Polyangia bacterium]